MSIKVISTVLIVGVITAVAIYAAVLLNATWPIDEYSVSKAGAFGDSFGLLTSLFSGLAFSGMIITILLQRKELSLQREELQENRKEFAKGAEAQERNAQLSALTTLLNEYKSQISVNEAAIEAEKENYTRTLGSKIHKKETALESETRDLVRRKEVIIRKIESILTESGVELEIVA